MTLVLNTLETNDYTTEQIKALLADKDADIEIVDTADFKIKHCMGCNNCWLKTPGICSIKDDYEFIIKKMVKASNLWLVTDTEFGFVNYRGKRIMDRLMPMLNMTIEIRDGWERHQVRYHAMNVGVIYKGNGNQELLEEWSERTAVNIGGHSLGVFRIDKDEAHESSVSGNATTISSATSPEKMEHIVIINGSPRVQKFSNTDKIIKSFTQGLESEGISHELYSLSNRSEWDKAREAFMNNTQIIIALPLYVECVPGTLLEFLTTISTERKQPAQISFILHGGFEEGHQLRLGEKFLQSLPAQLGCTYGGSLIKGGTFALRMRDNEYIKKMTQKMLDSYATMSKLFAQSNNFMFPEAKKFTGHEKNPWIFALLFKLFFKRLVKKNFERFAKAWGCTRPLDDKVYSE